MSMPRTLWAIVIPLFLWTQALYPKADIKIEKQDAQTYGLTINLQIPQGDFIYKDYLEVTVDHPDITLSSWQTESEPEQYFSRTFKDTKKIFNKAITLTLQATKNQDSDIKNAHIHLSYYSHKKNGMVEELLPLTFYQEACGEEDAILTNIDATQSDIQTIEENSEETKTPKTWAKYLEHLVQTTKSPWTRIIFALLLGILLSLTPCIYPMIPITVGILQAQKSKSVFQNFLLALAYVFGVSCTFAILGIISAFTGQMFGSLRLLANPVFIIVLVAFLIYLSLSMFGLYEIYIPRFMRKHNNGPKGTSVLSIFLFGIVSGTIASPCASPGLLLLLSIVATIANKLFGFLLLFSFGFGLGLPLLLIGTFSGSINVIPRAGVWMLEIKKIFGFLIFGACFYFLKNIIPWHIMTWLLSAFSLGTGIFYLLSIQPYDSKFWKLSKNIIGIIGCALSVYLAVHAYKVTVQEEKVDTFWQKDYTKALQQAKQENKKLLIDFWSTACTICTAIEKKVFTDNKVRKQLSSFITVKVDATHPSTEPFATLSKTYNVLTVPVFLIIDPHTGNVEKRWSSELYDLSNEQFIQEIQQY